MTPAILEMVMYLKINRELWDQSVVFKIRRDPRPRPRLPPPQPALEAAVGEANAAIAEANVEEFV